MSKYKAVSNPKGTRERAVVNRLRSLTVRTDQTQGVQSDLRWLMKEGKEKESENEWRRKKEQKKKVLYLELLIWFDLN